MAVRTSHPAPILLAQPPLRLTQRRTVLQVILSTPMTPAEGWISAMEHAVATAADPRADGARGVTALRRITGKR